MRGAHAPGEEAVARASGADLVLLAEVLLLAVALRRLGADLLVVLLERREVLAGLGELALLHALADVPVDEGALEKNVLKASSPPPMVESCVIWPSGWMPCSRQKSSQQALPDWMPAWPMWIVMHLRATSSR